MLCPLIGHQLTWWPLRGSFVRSFLRSATEVTKSNGKGSKAGAASPFHGDRTAAISLRQLSQSRPLRNHVKQTARQWQLGPRKEISESPPTRMILQRKIHSSPAHQDEGERGRAEGERVSKRTSESFLRSGLLPSFETTSRRRSRILFTRKRVLWPRLTREGR